MNIVEKACVACVAVVLAGCGPVDTEEVDLSVTNVLLYRGPGQEPIRNATISIKDGIIVSAGDRVSVKSRRTIDGEGRAATAGLWNSHVHFTNPQLENDPAPIVENMLLRFGFTTVVDAGPELRQTLELAESFDKGVLAGPRTLTASGSFVYSGGTPSYLPGIRLPEIDDPDAAEPMVSAVLAAGANGIKIFSGSFLSPTNTVHLPPGIIRAICDAAHANGAFVFSHPTTRDGLVNAVENGVDVLAHTAPSAGPLGRELVSEMVQRDVALIATLKLWRYELMNAGLPEEQALAFQQRGVNQLAEFLAGGGEVIFGTDVGYMSDFDPAEEYVLMSQAGMSFDAILAALTVNPANRFLGESGEVAAGARADLVIFDRDPAEDVANFAKVRYAIGHGRVLYEAQ